MTKNKTIIITVPTEIKKQLQIMAIQNDTNMNTIINELILNYIKENSATPINI